MIVRTRHNIKIEDGFYRIYKESFIFNYRFKTKLMWEFKEEDKELAMDKFINIIEV